MSVSRLLKRVNERDLIWEKGLRRCSHDEDFEVTSSRIRVHMSSQETEVETHRRAGHLKTGREWNDAAGGEARETLPAPRVQTSSLHDVNDKRVVIKPPGLWELVAPALGNRFKGHLRVQGTGLTTQDTAVTRGEVTGHCGASSPGKETDLRRELGDEGSEGNAGAPGPAFSSQTCSIVSAWPHRRPTRCSGHKPTCQSPFAPTPTPDSQPTSEFCLSRQIRTWTLPWRLAASSRLGHHPLCSG